MAMPFTTPLSARGPEPGAATPAASRPPHEGPAAAERGLQEPPESKQPRTLWQKIRHAFDYGNAGDTG